jgi:hypothetical protein
MARTYLVGWHQWPHESHLVVSFSLATMSGLIGRMYTGNRRGESPSA